MGDHDRRRLILVVGVGRSGTSLMTGILGQLGFHIPRPEVEADDTNPRGFSEPRWVVDLHTRLLRERLVTVNDSRPSAWTLTYAAEEDRAVRREVGEWLARQLDQGEAIVIKDPRTVWFLPLWVRCATELGVPTAFLTMLRHPAEVLTSAVTHYGTWQSQGSRATAWLNVSLETERATRGRLRAFVRYEDLLGDWRTEVARVGELLDQPLITAGIAPERASRVDEFVEPGLHRNRVHWTDVDVPKRIEELAEAAWGELGKLTGAGGDGDEAPARLDAIRETFVATHDEAEVIAQSAIAAAKRSRPRRRGKSEPPPSLRVRIARQIPERYRTRIRRVLRAAR